ncbi:glycosyltransferase family 2 protein [Aurantiacibacter suaedae]|uniref:glycosyltransferase family 2 protein n=1 Tax=Aurantiacibacter suaedae TaxID=2545755 RepID=UPI0010F70D62|nr:glycosyltransferase [Aurantiacibacter suaedae]
MPTPTPSSLPSPASSAKEPTVSVVMAVYNGEKFLAEAIASILDQTFRDFEFVIIDDGSTDRTPAILADFAAKDPRIRVFTQENIGLTKSLVRGVDASQGRLIARMDADDISFPTRLEKQARFLESHPEIELVTANIEFMDEAGKKRFDVAPLHFPSACVAFFMPFFNVMAGHGQVMYTRALYDRVNGYDVSFRFAQDYDLWERMSHHTMFGQIDEVLYRFRTSANSISKKNWSGQQECRARVSARSYERLTGTSVHDDLLLQINEFWHGSQLGTIGAKDLLQVDQAHREAFDAWNRVLRTRQEKAEVKTKVAEQFVKHGRCIPIKNFRDFVVCHSLAAKWNFSTVVKAGRRR